MGGKGIEEYEGKVVVHSAEKEEEEGWLVWDVEEEGGREEEEHDRRKIMTVKEKLTAMGKEGLFFRWIELVQFETAAKGGNLTVAGLQDVVKKGRCCSVSTGSGFRTFGQVWGAGRECRAWMLRDR